MVDTVFPHIVSAKTILIEFVNPTIQGRKLFKGRNYTYEEIQYQELSLKVNDLMLSEHIILMT